MDPYKPRPWLGFVRFLLLVMFVVSVYWLGLSMVRHHFFRGGAQDYNNWHNGSTP
jgi:hypothetical protein